MGERRRLLTAAELTELVERARSGDEAAWAELVRRFSRLVDGRVRSMGLSPAMVDDATQATWLRLAASLDQIRDPRRLGGWLRATARNEAINLVRRERRLVPSDGLDEVEEPADETDERLDRGARTAAVAAAIGTLNDRQRAIVELRFLRAEAESYANIADRLEIEPGSIGPTLGRAMRRMRRHPRVVEFAP